MGPREYWGDEWSVKIAFEGKVKPRRSKDAAMGKD